MRSCAIIHPLHLELETATLFDAGSPPKTLRTIFSNTVL